MCAATAKREKKIREKCIFGIKMRNFSALNILFQSVKHFELFSKKQFFQNLKSFVRHKKAKEMKLKTFSFHILLDNYQTNKNRQNDLQVRETANQTLFFWLSLQPLPLPPRTDLFH